MKEFFNIAIISIFAIIGWNIGEHSLNTPKELTYSQRRDIAIQFMCYESHWKGMHTFCGNLPPMDGKESK